MKQEIFLKGAMEMKIINIIKRIKKEIGIYLKVFVKVKGYK
jgi:hypothetical protein